MKKRFRSEKSIAVFVICALMSLHSCIAKNVQPHYYFIIGIAGDYSIPSYLYNLKFDKKEDAYIAYQNGAAPIASGIYSDLIPYPTGNTTLNGLPFGYTWNFQMIINSVTYPPVNMGNILRYAECPIGYVAKAPYNDTNVVYTCEDNVSAPEPDCDICKSKNPAPSLGKPILPSTGIEQEVETDYEGQGSNTLRFTRTYRSDRHGWAHNYQIFGVNFNAPTVEDLGAVPCYPSIGSVTGHSYCFPYAGSGQINDFGVFRGADRILNFGTSTDLSPALDINDRVTTIFDSQGNLIGYKVQKSSDDSIEWYDNNDHIMIIATRSGQIENFIYSDANTSKSIAPQSGLLIRVVNSFGSKLDFTYDSASRMVSMVDSTGAKYSYAYDEPSSVIVSGNVAVGNLTSVTYPDGKKRIYWYNEQDKTAGANLPYAMTGISDENGIRYAIIHYDALGKAISTELSSGTQKYSVSYPNLYQQTSVIDPLGTTRTYKFQATLGLVRSTGLIQPSSPEGTVASSIVYDSQGNVASTLDFNGIKVSYSYDLTRNLETSRTEAVGTVQARTITTTWHPTYRLPLQIAEPKRLTTFTYDASGNLLTKTIQATTDANGMQGMSAPAVGKPRVWTNTYNTVGQVLTATGPRTDVNDTTTYSYDGSGNLATVTNAAGHTTTLSGYDANGRVGTIVAPNGDTTNLTYTPRGWLSSRTVVANGVNEMTSYSYDGVGQLTQVTLPDNSTINYVYDDAHRLTSVSDSLGNSIVYTLDLMGNRISEQVKDTSGLLARQTSRVFDALNNLQQQTGGVQ